MIKKDFKIALKYFDLYYFLAKQDLKSRFRRSYLGIFWIVIHQLAFSLFAGFIWSRIFGIEVKSFIPFVIIGSVLWSFIYASMVEGCGTFIIAQSYLKQLPLPQSIFIFRTVLVSFFYLFIGMLTAIFMLLVFNKLSIAGLIYILPSVPLLIIYFYGISGSMAYLGLRYRDLQHALSSMLSMLFIVTPVIYPPEVLQQKGISAVLYLNPFASLIEIVRYPLINGSFASAEHYLIAGGFSLLMITSKYWLQKHWGRFVPFWA